MGNALEKTVEFTPEAYLAWESEQSERHEYERASSAVIALHSPSSSGPRLGTSPVTRSLAGGSALLMASRPVSPDRAILRS